jgi:hypothetical protein
MEGMAAAAGADGQFKAPSGHTFLVAPFTAQIIATLEEEALRTFKREKIRTLKENLDLLGGTIEEQQVSLRIELDRLAEMLVPDLPDKILMVPTVITEKDADGKEQKVVKSLPRKLTYVQWWLLTSLEARTLSCWLACRRRDQGLTREAFEEHFDGRPGEMAALSDLVADVNASKLPKKND